MASRRHRRAIRLGVPALVIGALTVFALWRVGTPRSRPEGVPAPQSSPLPPLTGAREIFAGDVVGRRASLERVAIRAVPSARTLWIGDDGTRVFVVLDPDVKKHHEARLIEGAHVTLIGLVRRAPAPDTAMRQWRLDAETAKAVESAGVYLHVTEVRAG